MNSQVATLIEKINALQSELDAELAKRRAELRVALSAAGPCSRKRFCAAIAN